jgi:hypothetical protein
MIERYGAELILFGHAHKTAHGGLATPAGLIPAIGVSAASSLGGSDERRSRYYLYTITPSAAAWLVHMDERVFAPDLHQFVAGRQLELTIPAGSR